MGEGSKPELNALDKVRRKRKAWPKKRDGHRLVLDKERLREQYLAAPHYSFHKFCEAEGYDYEARFLVEFPYRRWMSEWLESRMQRQDDETIASAVEARPNLLMERIRYVKEWGKSASNLKAIHDYMLSQIAADIQHDLKNADAITRDPKLRKFKLTPGKWMTMAIASEKLISIARQALLIPAQDQLNHVLPIPTKGADERQEEAELEELQNIGVSIIGQQEALTTQELGDTLAHWFDQHQEEKPATKTVEARVEPEAEPEAEEEDE